MRTKAIFDFRFSILDWRRRRPTARGLFVLALTLALLAAPLMGAAQQAAKVPRVGILWVPTATEISLYHETFRSGLRELGYVEGRTIAIEARYADGKAERLPALAAELVRLRVDVIVTQATPATLAASQATKTIPIVMVSATDPVKSGLVASLARPAGNITGVSSIAHELAGKRLQLLKEAVPGASRIAVLSNPTNPTMVLHLRETEAAARSLKVQLQVLEAGDPNELDTAFSRMTRGRADALVVLGDPTFLGQRRRLVELAAKSRLPAIFWRREFVEDGGLMAYGSSFRWEFRQAATYVDKILKGAKPEDLPVEQPMKFELVVNLKTAKALGLKIPQTILIRADQVIQ